MNALSIHQKIVRLEGPGKSSVVASNPYSKKCSSYLKGIGNSTPPSSVGYLTSIVFQEMTTESNGKNLEVDFFVSFIKAINIYRCFFL